MNLCDTDGYTPLHLACDNGHIDIVNILLKCNSSVNLCNTDGYTPLHLACYNGNIDIVNILLKCNSSVNLCYWCMFTKTTTQINVNIEFNKNVHNVFITFLQATCKGVDPLMSHRFTLLLHFSKLLTISILPFIQAT
jgi:ankyrin repeat protein